MLSSTAPPSPISPLTVGSDENVSPAERTKKYAQLASRLPSFPFKSKKRKLSETLMDAARVAAIEGGSATEITLPGTNIRRPLLDDREKAMCILREYFTYEGSQGGQRSTEVGWIEIRSCMEFFPLSAYCSLVFLSSTADGTQSPYFKRSLRGFLDRLKQWCNWDFLESVKRSPDIFQVITDAMDTATRPVKFTANGCFWKDIIKDALIRDFCEFKCIFTEPDISEVLEALYRDPDENTLQDVVDMVQFMMGHIESYDTRGLDRFLRLTVEKCGILPSSIFLGHVRRIGSNFVHGGGFADVWKGEYKEKLVALKVLRIFCFADREKMQREFSKEALLWRKLDHPNVLPFLGICRDEFAPQMALVSHWMDNGSLVEYLARTPTADCRNMAIGVARGLEYLHSLKPQIIHGDLRAANVLVDEDEEPRITDFGLARAIDSQGTPVSSFIGKGTLRWQAPELLHTSRFGEQAGKLTTRTDVYAFACVCYEIFTGKVPFADLRDGAVIMEVAINDKRPHWPGHATALKGLTGDVWFIMQDCWKTQPHDRPEMRPVVSRLESAEFLEKFVTMFKPE